MEDYPQTVIEFEERFSTEAACREYLRKLRWPNGFECPRCGYDKPWVTDRNLYICSRCGMHVSVLAGTIFQDTVLSVDPASDHDKAGAGQGFQLLKGVTTIYGVNLSHVHTPKK